LLSIHPYHDLCGVVYGHTLSLLSQENSDPGIGH
jgi:hypothetical protein